MFQSGIAINILLHRIQYHGGAKARQSEATSIIKNVKHYVYNDQSWERVDSHFPKRQ